MGMIIAHNLSAINTKRQFSTSAIGQSSAMEKLSSGYKINTGKDDPSGLVISEKLRSQLNGLKRAQQNTEEAINVMGIAEGALNEMNAILKKMKALAIHSNNTGVTSPDQIAADQAEMDSSIQTLDRIAQTTKFSEDNLLNGAKDIAYERTTAVKGTQQNSLLDVGKTGFNQIFKRDDYAVAISFTGTTNADEITGLGTVDFTKQAAKAYLEVDTAKDPDNEANIENGKFIREQQFTLTGTKGSRQFTFGVGESVATMVNQIKSAADSTGIDASLVFNSDQEIDFTTTGSVSSGSGLAADATFSIQGVNGGTAAAPTDVSFTLKKEMNDVLKDLNITGLTFSVSKDPNNSANFVLSANDGTKDITLTKGWSGAGGTLTAAITAQKAYDGGANTKLLDGLVANLSATGTITAAASPALETKVEFSNQNPAAVNQVVLKNIFGGAGADDGKATLELNVDWNKVYENLATDALKTAFKTAAEADTLKVSMAATGNQGTLGFTLTIADGSGNTFATQTIDTTPAQRAELKDSASTTLTIPAGGIFGGSELTVERMKADTSNINNAPASGAGSVALAAVSVSVKPNVSKEIEGTKVALATLANSTTGADPAAAQTLTMTGVLGAAAAITLEVTDGAATLDGSLLAAYQAANGPIKFSIRLNSGQLETDVTAGTATKPLYSIIASDNAGNELIVHTWDGKALSAAPTITAQDLKDLNDSGNIDFINALADVELVTSADIDYAASSGTAGGFLNLASGVFQAGGGGTTISFGSTEVAGNIYAATGTGYAATSNGNIQIKMDEFKLDALIADGSFDKDALIAAWNGGAAASVAGIKVSAAIENYDAATGKYDLSLNFHSSVTGASFGTAVVKMDDVIAGLNADGETNGWVTLGSGAGSLEGMQLQITRTSGKSAYTGLTSATLGTNSSANPVLGIGLDSKETVGSATSKAVSFGAAGTIGQVGGMDAAGTTAARAVGTVAVFNNVLAADAKTGITDGSVEKGITGIGITAAGAASVQLGKNTDGQGRIYVKFIDDGSYELYKDSSMSKESLVAQGVNGDPLTQANNSGLEGITINMTGTELTKVNGVYFTVAGIEGKSVTASGASASDGVAYNGDVVGDKTKTLFDAEKTLITGVELGKNTDSEGKLYLETVYDNDAKTAQVFAYKDAKKRPEDLVASSELFDVSAFGTAGTGSMTVVLNEKRNADNTAGTGLGIVLSTDAAKWANYDQDKTFGSTIEFKNLGARVYAQDYGSANFIKVNQQKGNIFSYYSSAGDNDSKRMVDATAGSVTVQVNGQDATLSINGTQVKTNGLELSMATQDIQANLVFNQGKVGSTTLAQVGYETASIFTKIGALNLGSVEAETEGKYEGLSGLMANAGHVTNEKIDSFQGGMQLQLGEGAGDQNRSVVAIKSVTSENLGVVTKGGYWDGDAVYTERTFTMKDVFGGGRASLKQSPTLAMSIIEQAISDVSELRAQIGAVQTNMLQTNSNNLAVTMENIQKTEAGIRDADMADEMTEFTKNQVLQNAAMSMLTQANQSSQNVLQLLR